MLKPELEETALDLECDFCRKYWHYSFKNKDDGKKGRPVLTHNGNLQKRDENQDPECDVCPRSILWNDENRAIYGEYMRSKHQYGKIAELADKFAAIDDEMIKINGAIISNAISAQFTGI